MLVGFAPGTLVKYSFSMEIPSLMIFLVGAVVVFVFNLLLMIFLMQKDNTRAEWIRGVSHGIRTPLSMVLDCATGSTAALRAGE